MAATPYLHSRIQFSWLSISSEWLQLVRLASDLFSPYILACIYTVHWDTLYCFLSAFLPCVSLCLKSSLCLQALHVFLTALLPGILIPRSFCLAPCTAPFPMQLHCLQCSLHSSTVQLSHEKHC